MKNTNIVGAVCVALAACTSSAYAAQIQTTFSHVGATTWDVSFNVAADAGQTIDAFSVYFDWAKVSNIAVTSTHTTWDSLAIQGDTFLPADGLFDSVALGSGISGGTTLSGFAARFDWADVTAPASMRYTINDPITFAAVETGYTVMATSVPEPSSWLLMVTGIGALVSLRKRPQQATAEV